MLYKQIILEWGQDTESGVWGLGYSPDNGKNFYVLNTTHGRKYRAEDGNRLYPYISDQVQDKIDTVVAPAKSAADSAQSAADAAIASAQVTSDAVSAIASATAEAKQGANDAMSRAKSAWDVAIGAKEAVTNFDPLLKSAQSDASNAIAQIADTASALSDAKAAFTSDVAVAKNLASTAQTTADNAIKSASSVADDLTTVANQAKANANGITKVTSDVGSLQTIVADNSGNISTIQETAKQIQQAVSDNAGNITVAKQTADSAATVASDARSNATVAIQTASQASITAKNASGQAASAVITANGAMTTASNAKSDATVAVQTASGASLTAINANSDATVAKQTASEAKVQASNAESDFAQLSIRAGKIEASVATNSGAIASVQQTANGLTTTVGKVDDRVKKIEDTTNWTTKTGALDMDTLTTTQNIYYRDSNLKNADGETGWAYIQVVSMGERVTQTVWHDRSSIQHTRTGALNSPNSNYNWDAWNKVATYAQVVEVKNTVDGIATTINDPKTGLNATYQTAAGNATTISNVKSDVYQLETTANGLTSRVGNLESKTNTQETAIEQNKNAITLKADQTDVDTVKGTVAGLQSSLTVQGNQIQTKVSASDVSGMLKGYATQDYTQSLVTQQANTLSSTITTVKNQVNSLESAIDWTTKTGPLDMDTLTTTQNIYYRDASLKNADGETGWAYIQVISMGERVTQTVWHDRSSIQHTRTGAVNGSNYDWDAWNQSATNSQVTAIKQTVDGIQTQVYNSDGSSKITQLSNVVQSKVSQGDYNSQINQLKNDINLRVQKGNVVSQINQEAGGNTLIQVSNGKGSFVLDAANTVITGKAWIPVAAIANLTADQIQAGTLTGSTVHLGDSSGNTIDLGVLGTNHVGLHSKATNGDQTYIDLNGIHNFGATYDTKISQGQITTNLLSVNGGGLIDFRSSGNGTTISNQEFQFYNSGSVNGGLSFSGSVPIAEAGDVGGNELRIRYDRSFAVTPISDESSRICASAHSIAMGFKQSGSSSPDVNITGLRVTGDRYFNLGVWSSDSKWSRVEAVPHNIHMQSDDAHAWLGGDGTFHIYRDNDGGSATATKLQVDGWAWVKGWVEAAGHSQHSTLSSKTRIEEANPEHMLDLINNTELTTFAFKSEVAEGTEARHIGPIIDDVNDVAQYRMPAEFIAPTKTARDDDNMIGALFGAVQALTKRIKALEEKTK